MNIRSEFTVGSEYGIDLLFELKEVQLNTMYGERIDAERRNAHIENELNRRAAINELNDFTTQMIITFEEHKALGYAIIKNSYETPNSLKDKKALRIYCYILPEYQNAEVVQSIWQKSLSANRNYSYWIEVLQNDPLIPLLESLGFRISETSELKPFNLPSYILIIEPN